MENETIDAAGDLCRSQNFTHSLLKVSRILNQNCPQIISAMVNKLKSKVPHRTAI